MIYLWAEVQQTLYTRNGLKGFKSYQVRAQSINGSMYTVFRSIFKHHCLRVSKFINCGSSDVSKDQIDEVAFDREYDKPVEEIITNKRLHSGVSA